MNSCLMQPAANRSIPLSLWGALAFFVLLWALDFPKPMNDDMFYCGAGLNLAQGGDLSNPLIARQEFPGHFYFIYPPVHSYALDGWLRTFGISAASMTGFQLLLYAACAATTIIFLRRNGAPVWLEWVVPLGVSAAFLGFGLRPESLAAALTMTGFVLVECRGKAAWTLFPGFFLLALGTATAPRTAPFGAALFLLAGYNQLWRKPEEASGKNLLRWSLGGAGALAAVLVFLWMIHFRVVEFWRTFHFYSQLVGGSKLQLLAMFFTRYLGITQWPVAGVLICVFLLSLRRPRDPLACTAMCLAAMVPIGGIIGGLGNGTLWFLILILLFLTGSLLKQETTSLRRKMIFFMVAGSLLLANFKTFVNLAGIFTGNIDSKSSANAEKIRELGTNAQYPLLIDEPVARYVFDYRLPVNALDWPFSAPFPKQLPFETNLLPGDIYLLGPLWAERLTDKELAKESPAMWSPLPLRQWAFYRHPREAYILPAAVCLKNQTNSSPTPKSLH
jgi:hypothetical protein